MTKPHILIEIQDDGNVNLGTNIVDKVLLRNTLRLAEEMVVADALKKASVEQKVIPVRGIPNVIRKPN